MTKRQEKDATLTSLQKVGLKTLLIALVAVLTGAIYVITPIISFILLQVIRADPYAPPIYNPFILYIIVATIGGLVVGILGLRSIAKAKWTASIASPIIAFALFYTCLITLVIIYGTNFTTELIASGCLVFLVGLICSTIVLDAIGKYAYIFALVYLVAFALWVPGFIQGGALDLRVDYQAHEVAKSTQAVFKAYSPDYAPKGYRLNQVEYMNYKNDISYSLSYSTGNMFSPYVPGGNSFSINVDKGTDIDPPKVCDYETTEAINNTQRPLPCEKVADTKACTLYVRHWEPFLNEKHTTYYCKIENTRIKMNWAEDLAQAEAIKIFDSLRPGISRP